MYGRCDGGGGWLCCVGGCCICACACGVGWACVVFVVGKVVGFGCLFGRRFVFVVVVTVGHGVVFVDFQFTTPR